MLFVICYSLFVICYLLFVICYLLSVICHLLFVICFLIFVISIFCLLVFVFVEAIMSNPFCKKGLTPFAKRGWPLYFINFFAYSGHETYNIKKSPFSKKKSLLCLGWDPNYPSHTTYLNLFVKASIYVSSIYIKLILYFFLWGGRAVGQNLSLDRDAYYNCYI